jgi:hypothetical protein
MIHGRVIALAAVVKQKAVASVFGYGEANGIKGPLGRKSAALPGVAQIAEFTQFFVAGIGPTACGGAGTAKTGSQRQAGGRRPVNCRAFIGGVKVRTRHKRQS